MGDMLRAWPPIIQDAHVPRAVVWRDRLLTCGMWLLLLFLMRHGFLLIWDELIELFGHARSGPPANWHDWWLRLKPYFITAAALACWLFGWGIVSLQRIKRHIGKPQPPALSLAEEASRIGCLETELDLWRSAKVATVHIEADGHIRVVIA